MFTSLPKIPLAVGWGDKANPTYSSLRSYLQGIKQREWNSAADTPTIVQDVLNLLLRNREDIGVGLR